MRVTGIEDCGNSPKNRLLADFVVALLGADGKKLGTMADTDLDFRIAGLSAHQGIPAAIAAIRTFLGAKPASLRISHALSHGRSGAVDGDVTMAGRKYYEFCCVFEFVNLKATHIARAKMWCAESAPLHDTRGEQA